MALFSGIINRYVDFAATPIFSFPVSVSVTDNNPGVVRAFKYYLNTIGNVSFPPKTNQIDAVSNPISTGYTYYNSDFHGGLWGGTVLRKITQVGIYQEQVALYASIFGAVFITEIDHQEPVTFANYIILQSAVPVTVQRDPTTNAAISTLGNLQTINAAINTVYRLDKSQNRGDEATSTWTVLKYDSTTSNTPITAIQNIDYTLVNGTLTSDIIDIKFLTSAFNFRIQNIASGYTFSNNPFINTNSDTTINSSVTSNDFLIIVTPITYSITFPRLDISLSVPSDVQISTVPITTYQNQPITVQAIVLNSTGIYNQVNGSIITPIAKTDLEWQNEMTTICNVVLNITEKVSGNLIQTANGFGPFIVSLNNVENYNFQYITTLK